jgi:hypothetical protein
MVNFKNNLTLSSQHQRRIEAGNKVEEGGGGGGDKDGGNGEEHHFFVVDMDLTSQGDMCEEISHLSDPTNMSSAPIKVVPAPGYGRLTSHGSIVRSSNTGSGNNNKRRISATKLLTKPIAAIRQSFGGSNNRQGNGNMNGNSGGGNNQYGGMGGNGNHHVSNKQQQRRSVVKPRKDVIPVLEEERESGGASDTSPLTMIVPGRPIAVGFGDPPLGPLPLYGTIHNNHHPSDVENRNPDTGSNNSNGNNKNQSIFRDPQRLSSSSNGQHGTQHVGNMLYQHPSMSWEDDPLLVFDDANSTTPKAAAAVAAHVPAGAAAAVATSGTNTMTEESALLVKNDGQRRKDSTTRVSTVSSWWSSVLTDKYTSDGTSCPRDRGNGGFNRLLQTIVQSWGWWALGMSFVLLLVSGITVATTSSGPQDLDDAAFSVVSLLVDTLYGAIVSVTTVGPAMTVVFHREEQASSGIDIGKAYLMIFCTMMYAMLGVTSLGIFWGRYAKKLLERAQMLQSNQQESMKDMVMTTFCDPLYSSRKLSTSLNNDRRNHQERMLGNDENDKVKDVTTNKKDNATSFSLWHRISSSRSVRIWFVPCLVVLMGMGLGVISGWSILESSYYTIITACTLSDTTIAPKTTTSKVLAILFIPLAVAMMIRWWLAIAQWMIATTPVRSPTHPQRAFPLDRAVARESTTPALSPTEVRDLLNRVQMEEGLLTMADFIEIMLLAMQKVDAQLILDLRRGFDCVTQGGAIDLTRLEWLDGAASRVSVDHPCVARHPSISRRQQAQQRQDDPGRTLWEGVLDWLLGEGGGSTDDDQGVENGRKQGLWQTTNSATYPKTSSMSSV